MDETQISGSILLPVVFIIVIRVNLHCIDLFYYIYKHVFKLSQFTNLISSSDNVAIYP